MRRIHPAQVSLAAIAVLSLVALWGTVSQFYQSRGVSWSGEPSDEVIMAMAFNHLSGAILMPTLATAAAASALGLILVSCIARAAQSSPRSTRTMSAAGSTENRTAVTVPKASPSISNS